LTAHKADRPALRIRPATFAQGLVATALRSALRACAAARPRTHEDARGVRAARQRSVLVLAIRGQARGAEGIGQRRRHLLHQQQRGIFLKGNVRRACALTLNAAVTRPPGAPEEALEG